MIQYLTGISLNKSGCKSHTALSSTVVTMAYTRTSRGVDLSSPLSRFILVVIVLSILVVLSSVFGIELTSVLESELVYGMLYAITAVHNSTLNTV